jgi:hypothetical protein
MAILLEGLGLLFENGGGILEIEVERDPKLRRVSIK